MAGPRGFEPRTYSFPQFIYDFVLGGCRALSIRLKSFKTIEAVILLRYGPLDLLILIELNKLYYINYLIR